MIVESIGIGSSFLIAWAVKSFIKKKNIKYKIAAYNIYPFEPLSNWHCPKCGKGWCNESIKFCECAEHFEGHFHMECKGKNENKKELGCEYKWMMESKK